MERPQLPKNRAEYAVEAGTLYLVATPIGNLGDITLRALDVLTSATQLWAEDTRNLRKLLGLYGIEIGARRVVACHEHNEAKMAKRAIDALKAGESIAYVSDAGTPMISDPGYRLAREAIEAGCNIRGVCGPSAAIAGLAIAGLPTDRFAFFGFAPAGGGARGRFFEDVSKSGMTAILFERAERLGVCLEELGKRFDPGTKLAILREMTKLHEEVIRTDLAGAKNAIARMVSKGEIVLVIGANREARWGEEEVKASLKELMEAQKPSQAARLVSARAGWSRGEVYKLAMELTEIGSGE